MFLGLKDFDGFKVTVTGAGCRIPITRHFLVTASPVIKAVTNFKQVRETSFFLQ
uniref:Uncharacterized protein n=1 Tax=Junco hyemalis TaxID=40217 RepID=A0A8C5J7P7_JUNHY